MIEWTYSIPFAAFTLDLASWTWADQDRSIHKQTSECMGIADARSPSKRWLYSAHEEYRKLAAGLSRAVVLKGKSIHLSGSIELSLFRGSKTPRWKIRVAFLPTWSGSAKAICTRISFLHGWPGLHLKFSIHINFPILFTSSISLSPFHQIWLNAQWPASDLRSKVHRSSIYKPFCRLDRLGKKNLNSSNPPDKSLADFAGAGPEKASNLLVVSFKYCFTFQHTAAFYLLV